MKAWLITLEGDEANEGDDKVVSILDPHLGRRVVREYVERIYADAHYSLGEKLNAARAGPRKHIPFAAEYNFRTIMVGSVQGPRFVDITCGPNPHLRARKVVDLELRNDEKGKETLYWSDQ